MMFIKVVEATAGNAIMQEYLQNVALITKKIRAPDTQAETRFEATRSVHARTHKTN